MTYVIVTAVVIAIVGLGVLYAAFLRTPQARWKFMVNKVCSTLDHRVRSAEHDLRDLKQDYSRRDERTRGEFFRAFLQSIPVTELAQYPGIGPVMISRIRERGYKTLLDAVDERDFQHVDGVGVSRNNDLLSAVRQLLKEKESQFDSGACPEGRQYRTRSAELKAMIEQRQSTLSTAIAYYENQLLLLEPLEELAKKVTLFGYWKGVRIPELTPELLAIPVRFSEFREADFGSTSRAPSPPPVGPSQSIAPTTPASRPASTPPLPPPPPRPSGSVASPTSPHASAPAPTPFPSPPSVVSSSPVPTFSPRPKSPPPTDLFAEALQSSAETSGGDHPQWPRMRAMSRLAIAFARADGRLTENDKRAVTAAIEERFGAIVELRERIPRLVTSESGEKGVKLGDAITAVKNQLSNAEWEPIREWLRGLSTKLGSSAKTADAWRVIESAFTPGTAVPTSVTIVAPSQPTLGHATGAAAVAVAASAGAVAPTPSIPSVPTPTTLSVHQARTILEIKPDWDLNVSLIRRQYNQLTDRFDPAKFEGHGAEFIAMAVQKRTAVRSAAERLMAEFGEPVDPPQAPPPPSDPRHNPDLDAVFGV